MEQRALLAFLISLAILLGYQALFAPVPQQVEQGPTQTLPETPEPSARRPFTSPGSMPELDQPFSQPEQVIRVETDLYIAEFTSFGGRLKSFLLKNYAADSGVDAEPLDMVRSDSLLPLGLQWRGAEDRVPHSVRKTKHPPKGFRSCTNQGFCVREVPPHTSHTKHTSPFAANRPNDANICRYDSPIRSTILGGDEEENE